uniref:Transmembrane protein n=1 Tax=Zooxanthella nutricula TaxID=1333877 RepID=A0A7S2M4P8_9DINO
MLVRNIPWLPLVFAGLLCIIVRVVLLVERYGLLALLPVPTPRMQAPLFELMGAIINTTAWVACNVLRVIMLACMELEEDQKKEILTSMDPKFRHYVFQQPLSQLLPWTLRRILLGRSVNSAKLNKVSSGRSKAAATETMRMVPELKAMPRRPSSTSMTPTGEPGAMSVTHSVSMSELRRMGTAENLLDLVRGMEQVACTAEAAKEVSALEKILQRKMMSTTVSAARSLACSAQAQVIESFEFGKTKVSEFSEGVKDAVTDPRAQVTAASAVGGAVALGTGGGATGLVSGGLMGAACGVVPALFTFGLSIPIGAAIGGGVGLCTGATLAGTAGLLGGGTVGYHAYGRESVCSLADSPASSAQQTSPGTTPR